MIILYTTHCPKCTVLETKLKTANIEYEICDDTEKMIQLGLDTVPVLKTEDKMLSFKEACDWINTL